MAPAVRCAGAWRMARRRPAGARETSHVRRRLDSID